MRGRKPIPTELRVLRNNPGKRAINADEPKPRVLMPVPPVSMKGEALEEWKRRAPQLVTLGLLTELDTPAFIGYCRSWGRYVDAEAKVEKVGEVVSAPSGYPIQNPYRAIANKALEQCKTFWAEFGMTPSSRSRVKVGKGSAPPASKLDRFIRRVK